MDGIWYVVGFAFAGVSFVFLTIGAAWLISHRNRGDVHKGLPYESGIDTYGDPHGRYGLSFYIYALLFVAFDIEIVFVFLWALVFRDLLVGGFVSMLIFVVSVPATMSTSAWRGLARNGNMPQRSMSLREVADDIISKAQQASPDRSGQRLFIRMRSRT